MSGETVIRGLDVGVTLYLAGFCLATIVLYAWSQFLHAPHWQPAMRASVSYLAIIGGLTLALALRPAPSVAPGVWEPITWFSFSMLLVMELLWLAFLLDRLRGRVPTPPRHLPDTHPTLGTPASHPHLGATPFSRSR